MIFLQVLRIFHHYSLEILPLFIIAFAVSVVALECFSARIFEKILQKSGGKSTISTILFGVLLPVTPGYRIPMAAIARRAGTTWTPVLTFIGVGAGAGISTFIVTLMIGWDFMALRLVATLIFSFLLSIIVAKVLEPRFAAAAMDSDVEPLFTRDFCEASTASIDKEDGVIEVVGLWRNGLSLARITLPWLLLSLLLATLIYVVVPRELVEEFLGGRFSAFTASLLGVPFYFVGGMEVPVILSLMSKGMSLGSAVSIMIAAPVVNVPVFTVMVRWLGYRRTFAFMAICWFISAAIGTVFNFIK